MGDKILVNDIIIIDKNRCGCAYTTFDKWFKSYRLDTDNYGKSLSEHVKDDNINEKYRCIWVAPHLKTSEMLYAIEGMDTKKVFLVNKNAILSYSHTCGSHDNTQLALEILSSEYHNLDLEFEKFKSSIKEQSAAATNDSNDMPELVDGMFGIAKNLPDGNISAFYVTKDTIIYENGTWDLHSIFDETGKSEYTQILALYGSTVRSFIVVKILYDDINNPKSNQSELIWKKKD